MLDRTLRHLPDAVLDAMRRGLDRHDGRLHPGKLFSDDGGCAVGVMLRELFPGYQVERGLIGRLRPRAESILDEHPRLARSLPRLAHIEIWFDTTIEVCRERDPHRTVAEWAQAVGRWCAGCLHAELERRRRWAAEPVPGFSAERPHDRRQLAAPRLRQQELQGRRRRVVAPVSPEVMWLERCVDGDGREQQREVQERIVEQLRRGMTARLGREPAC